MRFVAGAAFGNFQNPEDSGALPFGIFAKVFAPKPTPEYYPYPAEKTSANLQVRISSNIRKG
jgi:hypothetical protein